MTKKELEKDLRNAANGSSFVSVKQVAAFVGLGCTTTRSILSNLECTKVSGKKLFYVGDVAEILAKGAS